MAVFQGKVAGIIMAAATVFSPATIAAPMSSDALIVLTTIGYFTGAADACKVVPKLSNQLISGMALAINRGRYGDPAEAHVAMNNARQAGIAAVGAGKANCEKVEEKVRGIARSLVQK